MVADFSERALRIMRARSGGRCEGCGQVSRLEAHHRLYRSRGGDGGAANGLLLCGLGNTSGCHRKAHSGEGDVSGFSILRGGVPTLLPVWLARFGHVWLTDDGLVLAASGASCWEHLDRVIGAPGCARCVPVGRVIWSFEDEKGWGL